MPIHNCSLCGEELTHEFVLGENGAKYCKECAKKLIKCSEEGCNKYLKPEEAYLSGSGYLCRDHWERNYVWCSSCGALIKRPYANRISNGSYICNHCFESSYFTCDECGGTHLKEEAVDVFMHDQNCKICKRCREEYFSECPSCGELVHNSELVNSTYKKKNGTNGYFSACRRCIENTAHQCENCGGWFSNEIHFHDNNQTCDRCYYSGEIIHNYSFKPKAAPRKIGDESTELLFGVENEIELKYDYSDRSEYEEGEVNYEIVTESGTFGVDYKRYVAYHIDNAIPGFFYQKSDGSIDYGMEVVSHPATLQFWRSQKENIEKLFKFLRDEGCAGDEANTVGMHIHVSRNGMKRAHQNSFAAFVYSHRNKIETLAGRESNRFTKMIRLPNSAADSEETDRFERVVIDNDDRYSAVNWRNKNTVELRMFQSTLWTRNFIANIEFAHALYHFTIDKTVLECVNGESWDNFCNFVQEGRYLDLIDMMTERSIFSASSQN